VSAQDRLTVSRNEPRVGLRSGLELSEDAEQVIAAVDKLPAKFLGLELARQPKVTKDISIDAAGPGCFFFIGGQSMATMTSANDLPDQLFDLVLGKLQGCMAAKGNFDLEREPA
jgi:hypothetical protein